jgi:hypothetical protein
MINFINISMKKEIVKIQKIMSKDKKIGINLKIKINLNIIIMDLKKMDRKV